MKRFSVYPLILAFLLIAGARTATAAAEKFPAPKGYVNDFAGVIEPSEAGRLEEFLKKLESDTTAQVAVVTVPDMDGYADVDEYAVLLFKAWGIGQKGQDNGVLILLAMKERKARIEVGYGLEGAITDGTAGAIIREVMAPSFREGQYGKGLIAGARAVAERVPPGGVKKPAKRKKGVSLVTLAIFLLLILSQLLFPGPRLIGRRRYYGGGPFIGGFGGGFGGGGFGGGFGGFGGGGSGGGGASGGW